MKRISFSKMAIIVITVSSLLPFFDAAADDTTCVLKSDMAKIYITVWDDDSDGDRQGKIFEGWLESGERQTIKSQTGYIDFSYKLADDDRSYGDNFKICSGGNTIRVP
ncbi:MAG: hypothetical protein PVI00_03205 [Desulfobacterales bacterium]|jgi:hypothetical protein